MMIQDNNQILYLNHLPPYLKDSSSFSSYCIYIYIYIYQWTLSIRKYIYQEIYLFVFWILYTYICIYIQRFILSNVFWLKSKILSTTIELCNAINNKFKGVASNSKNYKLFS